MKYLLDTNVISEMWRGARAHPAVRLWLASVASADLATSALVFGELRSGVEKIRLRDAATARVLEQRLEAAQSVFAGRVFDVTPAICDAWGRLNARFGPLPAIDGLLAATALAHGMTLATRDTGDIARTGVPIINPFA